jgi:hypothetical protein
LIQATVAFATTLTLIDQALPYVKTPSVYNNNASGLPANAPTDARKVFESVKPITTRRNPYYMCLERVVKLYECESRIYTR